MEIKNKKRIKILKKAAYVTAAVGLGFFVLMELVGISTFAMAFGRDFYKRQFDENNAALNNHLYLDDEQLAYVIDDLLSYLTLGDGREYLDTTVEIAGESVRVFMRPDGGGGYDDIQVRHMKDVKNIFIAIQIIMIIGAAAIPLCIAAMILLKRSEGRRENFKKFTAVTLCALGGLLLAAVIWALIDFNGIFTLFHRVVFTNDDWMLSYDDLLLEMLPENLFMTLALRIGGLFFGLLAVLSAGILLQNKLFRKNVPRGTFYC